MKGNKQLLKQDKLGNITEEDLIAKQEACKNYLIILCLVSSLEMKKLELEEKTKAEIREIELSISQLNNDIK